MNTELEHQESSESLAAYALGALPEPESARLRRHLEDCRECRAQFEWLRVAADALPGSVQPIDPPPELKARIMNAVESEAELLRAAGEAADRPQPRQPSGRRRWLPTGWLRPALALGATGLIALGLVLGLSGGSTTSRTIRAQVIGPGHAFVVVRHGQAQLVVTGLRRPAPGHVDELWVQRANGHVSPAGTFVIRSGAVVLERPVGRGDVVMVTVEPGRGTSAPTNKPFIVARV